MLLGREKESTAVALVAPDLHKGAMLLPPMLKKHARYWRLTPFVGVGVRAQQPHEPDARRTIFINPFRCNSPANLVHQLPVFAQMSLKTVSRPRQCTGSAML